MKKLHLFIVLVSLFILNSWSLYAIPAKPAPFVMKQADGTELTVRLRGDENFHFYTSEDGYLLLPDEDGIFHYADLQSGILKVSAFRARNVSDRTPSEQTFIRSLDKTGLLQVLQSQSSLKQARFKVPQQKSLTTYPTIGEQKALIILVQFSDRKFMVEDPRKAFDDMINKPGYSDNMGTGSARDFFMHNSSGKYLPDFDVYGPVTLANSMNYYGSNSMGGNDMHPEEMVIEACNQLDAQINFAEYDRDQDGFVDNIYVFYAGYGEADGGPTNSVWPHAWKIYKGANKTLILDGVQIDSYACSNELKDGSGTNMNGIGTFCHEFSHVLGLPDLYATNYAQSFTPGKWSLMDIGSYNNEGITPPYMSAFERYSLGWLEPVLVSAADTTFVLPDISHNSAYVIKTDKENEYFLLENRQQHNWDTYLPGHGMLVWHIDYNDQVWASNKVNNTPNHQYIDIEEADGTQSENTRIGDSFPGNKNVTSITDNTSPGFKGWNGKKQNLSVHQITEKEGLITFSVIDPRLPVNTPKVKPATAISPSSFQANWEKTSGAVNYELSVYIKENGSIVYLPDYENKEITNVDSYIVSDLTPATDYYYVVKGKNEAQASFNSEETHVRTLDATFDYFAPVATQASSVRSNYFVANWEALDGAGDYFIRVNKKIQGDAIRLENDFTDGIIMPQGWSTDCSSVYNPDGYFGNAAPSLKFGQDQCMLESPKIEGNISSLDFWCRGVSTEIENTFLVSGYNGKEWVDIYSINPIDNNGKKYSLGKEELGGKYKAVRFKFLKNGNGAVALDDVVIESDGISKETLEQYNWKNVGNQLSASLEGLDANTEYSYVVKAYNGSLYSAVSNEITVTTLDGSSIGCLKLIPGSVYAYVAGNVLMLENRTSEPREVNIFTPMGTLLISQKLPEGSISLDLPAGQIYIIKIENLVFKVAL